MSNLLLEPKQNKKETVSAKEQASAFSPKIKVISYQSLAPLLQRVQKPGRYIGGEFGIPNKDPLQTQVRVLLSYLDTYELGMSNEGLRILYDRVNRQENLLADRTYIPWPDFQNELETANLPLYSLDHFLTADSFDVWGFNASHELHYTNLCYALDLAKLPILRKERRPHDPFIIIGGTAISNPLPLFDFADGIFLGDGEEGLVEISNIIAQHKSEASSREIILENLQAVEGLLLPALYKIEDLGLGSYPKYLGPKIKKRNYRSSSVSSLEHILVPNISIVQDRVVVEVARGCGQGCRFCHAGFWKRPVRSHEVKTLVKTAGDMLKKTGQNSISLHSLSLADYPWLEELVVEMAQAYGEDGISLSLPSLRVQVKTIPVLEMTSQIRRSNVTFALEAGSELQRERIRKKSSEENLHYLIRQVYARGWDLVKVYFMIGLPDKDGSELEELARALNALGQLAQECGPRKKINVTISLFIPKPFTTFQWEKQQTPEYFKKALHYLHAQLKSKRVKLKGPSGEMAYIEGLLSRSDHRIGQWILTAYRHGARFDSWDDQFRSDIWKKIYETIPPAISQLWLEAKEAGSALPWHALIDGVKPELLYKDHQRYESISKDNMNPPHKQALRESDFPKELLKPVQIPTQKFKTHAILTLNYARTVPFIYVSHLETTNVWRRACRRAQLPMTFSQGYNKQEKLHSFDALPIYFHSHSENLYIELYAPIDLQEKQERLRANLPKGLQLLSLKVADTLPENTKILEQKQHYCLEFSNQDIANKCYKLLQQAPEYCEYERALYPKASHKIKQKKNKKQHKKLSLALGEFTLDTEKNCIDLEIAHSSSGAISMKALLEHYLGLGPKSWNITVKITRIC